MVRRVVTPDKKMFLETITAMRKMVKEHRGGYTRDVMGLNKTNTKVPYTHLVGRRQQLKSRHAHEKARAREEAIQYDSSMQLLNSQVMEEHKEKDSFQKNQYKYEQVSQGKIGRESNGFLYLSKRDIDRINDRPEHLAKNNKGQGKQKEGKRPFKKNKNKQKKAKRGGKANKKSGSAF